MIKCDQYQLISKPRSGAMSIPTRMRIAHQGHQLPVKRTVARTSLSPYPLLSTRIIDNDVRFCVSQPWGRYFTERQNSTCMSDIKSRPETSGRLQVVPH